MCCHRGLVMCCHRGLVMCCHRGLVICCKACIKFERHLNLDLSSTLGRRCALIKMNKTSNKRQKKVGQCH